MDDLHAATEGEHPGEGGGSHHDQHNHGGGLTRLDQGLETRTQLAIAKDHVEQEGDTHAYG